MTNRETVGARIGALLKLQNIKQKDFATRIGISAAYLSLVRKGKANMSLALMKKMASALELPFEEFIFTLFPPPTPMSNQLEKKVKIILKEVLQILSPDVSNHVA